MISLNTGGRSSHTTHEYIFCVEIEVCILEITVHCERVHKFVFLNALERCDKDHLKKYQKWFFKAGDT